MKATSTPWLLVACFTCPAAYAIPPELGDNDASISVIESESLTALPTRLVGEVLYDLRNTLGENGPGEAALIGSAGRMRLGFDSSFVGEDVLRARVSGGLGYNENVGEWIYDGDNSSFLFLAGDVGAKIENGPFTLSAGLGGGFTLYDEDLDWRDDDENFVGDLELAVGATYRLSDSAVLKGFLNGYYGGNASISRDFLKGGVTASNYFYWNLGLAADYRFDGLALGEPGFELSSGLRWTGLAEDSDNSVADDLDNFRVNLRQEARYNINVDNTVFLAGSYGFREFDDFRPMGSTFYSADSQNFRVGAGVRHGCGGNATASVEAGVEFRDYDDVPDIGDDERTELYINGDINWALTDALSLGLYADYGIQNFQINEFPADAYVDPLGLRGGLRANYQWTSITSLTADWNVTRAHGSDVIDPFFDDDDFYRCALGLSLNHQLNDRVELFADTELVKLDNDFDDETYFRGAIGARVGF